MLIYLNNVNDLQSYLTDGRKLIAQRENSSIEAITIEKVAHSTLYLQFQGIWHSVLASTVNRHSCGIRNACRQLSHTLKRNINECI